MVTRKGGDGSLGSIVSLIIIDEVHLLADERGAVIETIVARTQRYIESSQRFVRLVGLSATLPNYRDVATFLRVNPTKGLFHFGPEYRPTPLDQTFIGITEKSRTKQKELMNLHAYSKMMHALQRDKQVMIFVHSRKETVATLEAMRELCAKNATIGMLETYVTQHPQYGIWKKAIEKSKSAELQQLFHVGMGMHNAGMLRSDRGLVEAMFECGILRVLCCTATLAWGVNLPAHTVIVKGTEIYEPDRGGFVDVSILDVMQIFGRAGRPQYDVTGHAILLTAHNKLNNYLSMLARQSPMESSFIKSLPDHLNAEIVNGTISNIQEASSWLSYTFLFIRMKKNPIPYGMKFEEIFNDPGLVQKRKELVHDAAVLLDQAMMVRYDAHGVSGNLAVTDLGRVASHYYIKYQTIESFNNNLRAHLTDSESLHVLCSSAEFDQLKVRPEEVAEIDMLKNFSRIPIRASSDDTAGKVNTLLQAYINRCRISSFTLQSDTNYVAQNASRIGRALFEICLKRGWSSMAAQFLDLCKALDKKMLPQQHPLRQFLDMRNNESGLCITYDLIKKIEGLSLSVDRLIDYSANELAHMLHCNNKVGSFIISMVRRLPHLRVESMIQPITRGVLRVKLTLNCDFSWSDSYHGPSEPFWIWIEDTNNEYIYHSEYFVLNKKQRFEPHELEFTIPIREPLPPQYYIRVVSDYWVGCGSTIPLSFQHLILPDVYPPHTDLLNVHPLPVEALHNQQFEALYKHRFACFNPIQSQIFHALYHTDVNVLVGAPTGSGKTITSELAILRLLNNRSNNNRNGKCKGKVVYIAPLKALARERLSDWKTKFGFNPKNPDALNLTVLELSGDVTPNIEALNRADIIIATPEKWDGITRGWKLRNYVQNVELVIIDEIHLLGEERGPVLEIIVSRMRYISAHTHKPIRFVGLSTALANANDLGDWLGIATHSVNKSRGEGANQRSKQVGDKKMKKMKNRIEETDCAVNGMVGLYNFRPSVRPVPMVIHIQGFPGKHYCPRMATMNKPCYANIREHSPTKPVLIFVSSRRQTRLTALDLISYCAAEENPKQFLHMDEELAAQISSGIKDSALRDTLVFGIGIHHAGLDIHDRNTVEELFVTNKIQVLVCTSTLAWGVNFPAHLVIVKGTEYFDGKTCTYVDFPVTDVLQMMGRAGRPQFDDHGVACILVHEPKKTFYKKFLHEPFPVESSLHKQLHNHVNAEIAGGVIRNGILDCIEFLTWTYFFRRLTMNPSYYQLMDTTPTGMTRYVQQLLKGVLMDLESVGCIVVPNKELCNAVFPTPYGHIASRYYIDYQTIGIFSHGISILHELRRVHSSADRARNGVDMSYIYKDMSFTTASSMSHISVTKYMDSFPISTLLRLVCTAMEFSELPVRHNEEHLNADLAKVVQWKLSSEATKKSKRWTTMRLDLKAYVLNLLFPPQLEENDVLNATQGVDEVSSSGLEDDPQSAHVKAYLLLQARLQHLELPIMDYINDTKTVMDQFTRVLSCLMDMLVVSHRVQGQRGLENNSDKHGCLDIYLGYTYVSQLMAQSAMPDHAEFMQIPHKIRFLTHSNGTKAERGSPSGAEYLAKVKKLKLHSLRDVLQYNRKSNSKCDSKAEQNDSSQILNIQGMQSWIRNKLITISGLMNRRLGTVAHSTTDADADTSTTPSSNLNEDESDGVKESVSKPSSSLTSIQNEQLAEQSLNLKKQKDGKLRDFELSEMQFQMGSASDGFEKETSASPCIENDQLVQYQCEVTVTSRSDGGSTDNQANSNQSKNSKDRESGYWLVVGSTVHNTILGVKRYTMKQTNRSESQRITIQYEVSTAYVNNLNQEKHGSDLKEGKCKSKPNAPCSGDICLFVCSDTYVGLDHVYPLDMSA